MDVDEQAGELCLQWSMHYVNALYQKINKSSLHIFYEIRWKM